MVSQTANRPLATAKAEHIDESLEHHDAALQTLAKKVCKLIVGVQRMEMDKGYEIGAMIRDHIAKLREKKDGTTYGDRVYSQLAIEVGVPEQTLRTLARIAEDYTQEAFKELAACGVFSVSHMKHLVRIVDPDKRQQLEDRVRRERLTADQLSKEVRSLVQSKPRGPGRTPVPPSKPLPRAKWLRGKVANFGRSLQAVTEPRMDSIAACLIETSPNEWTEELASEVDQARQELLALADSTQAVASLLASGLELGLAALKRKERSSRADAENSPKFDSGGSSKLSDHLEDDDSADESAEDEADAGDEETAEDDGSDDDTDADDDDADGDEDEDGEAPVRSPHKKQVRRTVAPACQHRTKRS